MKQSEIEAWRWLRQAEADMGVFEPGDDCFACHLPDLRIFFWRESIHGS